MKLMGYCYIVVIKKAGAWGCWGGAILPYVLNPLNALRLLDKLVGGVQINNNNINSKLQ